MKTKTMCEPTENQKVIFHYRIVSKLGAGGMGEVNLAEDTSFASQERAQDSPCRGCS